MKRNTKLIGDISELTVMRPLIQIGYRIFVPWGEHCRYDLAAEKDGVFWRVQVKTGQLKCGATIFNCFSTHSHRGGSVRFYNGEIDFCGVYCPQVDAVFLVPVDHVRRSACLRRERAKNGQFKKIRWAEKYIISTLPSAVGRGSRDVVSNASMPPRLPL